MVVAIPLARPVEGHDEAVGALERLEHLRGPRRLEHGVAQPAAHPIQHRCVSEEPRLGRRQPGQELQAEVLGHEPVVPCQDLDGRRLRAPACRDSAARYRPAGQPSVRSVSSESCSRRARCRRRPAAARPPARPVGGPRRRSPAPTPAPASGRAAAPAPRGSRLRSANPPERSWTSSARTSRQAPLVTRWRSSSTSTIGCSSRAIAARHAGTLVVQATAAGPDSTLRTSAETASTPKDRGRDVPQEHPWVVVVPPVERHPRERPRLALGPPREERRLAVPGRRDDGRQTCALERSRAITSAFATVPGRIDGGASLTSTTSNGRSRYRHPRDATTRSQRRDRDDFPLREAPHFMPSV